MMLPAPVCGPLASNHRTAGGRGSEGHQSLRRMSHLRAGWSGLAGIGSEAAHQGRTKFTWSLAVASRPGRWLARRLAWGDGLPVSQPRARA